MAFRSDLPWRALLAGQLVVAFLVLGVVLAVAYVLFVWYPTDLVDLLGVVLLVALGVIGLRLGGSVAASVFPAYNVGEVAVEGPITRDGGQFTPRSPGVPSADELVEQIDIAAADPAVRGLLVKLNTPGGQVVPSDDIREAITRFDGPTVAYTTDVCASGGYWIASGCDEIWARDASIVGSIGVRGSRLNVAELADRLGVSHERFTAGEYKDAGSPFREMEAHEREYIQELVDAHYDYFVDRVADGRNLDTDKIRETQARVFLGEEAYRIGLVDEIGARDDVEAAMAEHLGLDEVRVREFKPERPMIERLRLGIEGVAFVLGAGIASRLGAEHIALPEAR